MAAITPSPSTHFFSRHVSHEYLTRFLTFLWAASRLFAKVGGAGSRFTRPVELSPWLTPGGYRGVVFILGGDPGVEDIAGPVRLSRWRREGRRAGERSVPADEGDKRGEGAAAKSRPLQLALPGTPPLRSPSACAPRPVRDVWGSLRLPSRRPRLSLSYYGAREVRSSKAIASMGIAPRQGKLRVQRLPIRAKTGEAKANSMPRNTPRRQPGSRFCTDRLAFRVVNVIESMLGTCWEVCRPIT